MTGRGARDARPAADAAGSAADAATAAAYAAHAASVTALAARVLGDPDAARDVCQEAFVRFHARALDLGGDPGPWLRAVAWRLALDGRRRRGREAVALGRAARGPAGGDARDAPERAAEDREARERLVDAVQALSTRQRDVLLLRVVDGASFPAVARSLALSEGSAKVHLRRALARLRDAVSGLAPARGAPTPAHADPQPEEVP